MSKYCLYSLVGWWALFTRCGPSYNERKWQQASHRTPSWSATLLHDLKWFPQQCLNWGPGNPEIWRSGDLEIQKFGVQKFKNIKFLRIQIRSAQNVGKVWISRKKILLALFGAIQGHFLHGPEKSPKFCLFSLVGQWALFTRFGVMCWCHVHASLAFNLLTLLICKTHICGRSSCTMDFLLASTVEVRVLLELFFSNLGQLLKIFYFFADFWWFHGPFWGQEGSRNDPMP